MAKKLTNPVTDTSSDNMLAPVAGTAPEPGMHGTKRKAVTTQRAKKTAGQDKKVKVEETKTTASARKTATKINDIDSQAPARPERAATNKAVVEEEETEDDVVADDKVKVKTKTTTKATKTATTKVAKANTKAEGEDHDGEDAAKPRKTTTAATKHAKILPPLEQRTKDTKHRIGAHVSIAGGKYPNLELLYTTLSNMASTMAI
ncbi:hypothetical protein GMOD_00006310 [Pyrenophora seminiperda CCB06]|uniref:Uncharacterized protein n=1 Tax=Pyrenophora seminiperda CCB06 TaxID=1302712 RepID=A0A3M7M4T8_9PLEO|nr:hypothetical protein GMOD_00006310 [Pyrenophora seminiperda CCB06]